MCMKKNGNILKPVEDDCFSLVVAMAVNVTVFSSSLH